MYTNKIKEETCSLESVLAERLKLIESRGLLRKIKTSTRFKSPAGNMIMAEDGKKLISFSCNDYMDLLNNEQVKKAAIDAIKLYGVGAGASRLITGNHPLYRDIEEKIAKVYKTEAALVFSSGYLANVGSIAAMVDRHDMILADKLVHASAIDGAQLSGAKIYRFAHNNLSHCVKLLQNYREKHKHCLVLVENIYGMDGDRAPIDDLVRLTKKYNAWLAVDVAHGFGTLPSSQQPDLYIGTLSKATGSLGGYVCASKVTVEYLQNRARTFIYTTALPPAIVAASSISIDILSKNADTPLQLARVFCQILELPEPQSHIVPIILKTPQSALSAAHTLAENGFLVAAIRPPTVPTPRLRFAFTAAHKLTDIYKVCKVIQENDIMST